MAAGIVDLYCEQGTDFLRRITVKNADGTLRGLSGYTARGMVRRFPSDAAPLATFVCSAITSSVFTISLTNTTTAALPPGEYSYDVELVSGSGGVERLLKGSFKVDAEVTK